MIGANKDRGNKQFIVRDMRSRTCSLLIILFYLRYASVIAICTRHISFIFHLSNLLQKWIKKIMSSKRKIKSDLF